MFNVSFLRGSGGGEGLLWVACRNTGRRLDDTEQSGMARLCHILYACPISRMRKVHLHQTNKFNSIVSQSSTTVSHREGENDCVLFEKMTGLLDRYQKCWTRLHFSHRAWSSDTRLNPTGCQQTGGPSNSNEKSSATTKLNSAIKSSANVQSE